MKSQVNRITGPMRSFLLSHSNIVAVVMLAAMFGLGMWSMVGNSAIMDEVAHIPAAYSYLHYGDYRLNPEHPPLIKDLAGIPLQFMHLKFPINDASWTSEVNGEWDVGWSFLYNLGNNASAILFWARLPILLLSVGFGWFFFTFVRRRWGEATALLALGFYVFSPNILAASITVTTDLGAALFMFVAVASFIRYVQKPTRANLFLMSLGIALAQLAKFSGVVVYPFMALMAILLVAVGVQPRTRPERWRVYAGGFVTASVLSVIWVWLFYTPQTWNMPAAVQQRLIAGSLVTPNVQTEAHILLWFSQFALFKPIVQFALGLVMVLMRVTGGNVTYFNGQVTDMSFHGYFPETFLFKTQVGLLLLMGVAMAIGLGRYLRRDEMPYWDKFCSHFRSHFAEWTLGLFAAFYFAVAVAGNLNLGVRHILPVYLPIFVLVARQCVVWLRRVNGHKGQLRVSAAIGVAVIWYAASTLLQAPSYISYFNELAGGPGNAYHYFTDSSIDWGQDLLRLKSYLAAHPEIHHIALDYFGGAVPQYYFCNRLYDSHGHLITTFDGYDCSHSIMEIWHSSYGRYTGQYIAVSETYLENDRYFSALDGQPGYAYLRAMTPIAKVGNSIYVYKLY